MNAHYYAKFTKTDNTVFRNDTRIYFTDEPPKNEKGRCLGVVIAKNPGSAAPKKLDEWTELKLGKDKMLPTVKNIFRKSFEKIKYVPEVNDYLRILNLFNICSPDVDEALSFKSDNNNVYIEKAKNDLEKAPLIFLAWGSEDKLNPFREIWINNLCGYESKCLYVTYIKYPNYKIAYGIPNISTKVKHPQGLPHQIVVDNIDGILKKFLNNVNSI